MVPVEDRLEKVLLFCLPAMIVMIGCGAGMLTPHAIRELLDFLTAWTFASVPLAVLVGHCALDED
ncbi:MAG TPA: hypothetical protein VMB71_07895 [Acetobacteraceae bacterium]|nr:hypothetical protein [Acetobacteraceae bacterium]